MSTPPMNVLPPGGPGKDKLSPDLRFLVASLLCVVVFLVYMRFFGPKPPANLPQVNKPAQSAPATPSAATPAGTTAPSRATSAQGSITAPTASSMPATADSSEHTVVVENELYRVEFSNRGAVVKSWQLKKYKDDFTTDSGKPQQRTLDLVNPMLLHEAGDWPFSMVFDDSQLENAANTALYKISADGTSLTAPADLKFTWSDGHLEVTKTFHFDHSYVVNVNTTTTYNGAHVLAGLAWRGWFGDWTVTDPAPSTTINTFYSENGKLATFLAKKLDGPEKWGTSGKAGKRLRELRTAISRQCSWRQRMRCRRRCKHATGKSGQSGNSKEKISRSPSRKWQRLRPRSR